MGVFVQKRFLFFKNICTHERKFVPLHPILDKKTIYKHFKLTNYVRNRSKSNGHYR